MGEKDGTKSLMDVIGVKKEEAVEIVKTEVEGEAVRSLSDMGISEDLLAGAIGKMDKVISSGAGTVNPNDVLQPEFMSSMGEGMKEFTDTLATLTEIGKSEGLDLVTVGEIKDGVNTQSSSPELPPIVETPVGDIKKASTIIVEENKNRLATRISAANSDITEKLALRRRKGKSASGYMYSSNLMVKLYNMDTPLKKKELETAYEYFTLTSFTSRKTLRNLFDYTSVICSDGDRIGFEQFLEMMGIDDLDDYLAISMIASTPEGKMKNFPVQCISEKHPDCGHAFNVDVDIKAIMESSVKSDFITKMSKYDRTKTAAELTKDSVTAVEMNVKYIDEDKDERIDIKMTAPSFRKYFEVSDVIKNAIIRELMSKDYITKYILQKFPEKFQYSLTDDKLAILAEAFPNEYGEVIIIFAHMYYIDGITIYPLEYIQRAGTLTPDEEKELKTQILELGPVNENNIEHYREILMDFPDKIFDAIGEETAKLAENKREAYTLTYTCPKCGDTLTGTISMYDIFFVWVSSSNEMKN